MSDALAGIRAWLGTVSLPFCTLVLAPRRRRGQVEQPGRGDVIRGWDDAVRGLSTRFVAFNLRQADVRWTRRCRRAERCCGGSLDPPTSSANFTPGAAFPARSQPGRPPRGRSETRLLALGLRSGGRTARSRPTTSSSRGVGLLLTRHAPTRRRDQIPITDQIRRIYAALGFWLPSPARANGRGTFLDVSILEAAVHWLAYYPHHWWHAGEEPPRSGMRHQYLCPYGPFRAADGRFVNVVVASDADWDRFCTAVTGPSGSAIRGSRPCLLAGPIARTRRPGRARRRLPRRALVRRLDAAGLPYGRVRSIAEVLGTHQLVGRGVFGTADSQVARCRSCASAQVARAVTSTQPRRNTRTRC
jgi:crotonobetainyl-CoA:carnitine CoA-transferase CaiB-like acyl-CoA transferase